MRKKAITRTQAIVIAVIIIVVVVAGATYYIATLPPAAPPPAPPTAPPTAPPPAPPTAPPAPPPKDYVVIGVAHTLSGPTAAACALHHAYYYMIIEDYNARGGLYVPDYGKRLPIKLIEYDDKNSIDAMLTLVEKLIVEDKVDLLFAPWGTAFNFAVFPLTERYRYPLVALTFGSEIAAEKMRKGEFRYAFSVLGLPSETGKEIADLFEYINKNIALIKRIGIIYHSDQHGVEYSGAIFSHLVMRGFEVPVHQSYPPDIADFTPLISTLRTANVDVVILCGYTEGALFVHQCKAQNFNPKLIFIGPTMEVPGLVYGPFGFTPRDLIGVCYYDGWPATAYKDPKLKEWAEGHKRRIGAYPFPASATFYAALECLFQAVEKYSLDRDKIRDALATETFNTIVGKFRFRQGYSAQCELAGTLTQWQGGDMMEVIWPHEVASADIICPKPPWPS